MFRSSLMPIPLGPRKRDQSPAEAALAITTAESSARRAGIRGCMMRFSGIPGGPLGRLLRVSYEATSGNRSFDPFRKGIRRESAPDTDRAGAALRNVALVQRQRGGQRPGARVATDRAGDRYHDHGGSAGLHRRDAPV